MFLGGAGVIGCAVSSASLLWGWFGLLTLKRQRQGVGL
jgi:hypothetical protein